MTDKPAWESQTLEEATRGSLSKDENMARIRAAFCEPADRDEQPVDKYEKFHGLRPKAGDEE